MEMKMINKAARDDMIEANMPLGQAEAVATHIPDWSRFATKADLEALRHDLRHELKDLRHDLTWRMVTVMAVPVALLVLDRFFPG